MNIAHIKYKLIDIYVSIIMDSVAVLSAVLTALL